LCAPPGGSYAAVTNIKTGVLWKYLTEYQLYRCPADLKTNSPLFLARGQRQTSYLMNGALCAYSTGQKKTFRQNQYSPDDIVFWQAREDTPGDFNDGSSTPNEGIFRRHNDGTTVGSMGGHIEFMKWRKFATFNTAFRTRAWCNPLTANGH
jgi:hypothetical protein